MNQHSPAVNDRTFSSELAMGAVSLYVGDLENMSNYYAQALALEPIEERAIAGQVHRVLGRGTTPLIRLIHAPELPELSLKDAGLFHTAFLFDDAASLAATVYRAAQDPRSRFAGSSDHLVSEAFYFTDPEGNGIELYVDRPRETWGIMNGEIKMDTIYLDPNAYLKEHLDENVLATASAQAGRVGHVHLQVGDVQTAREFYVGTLGFEATAQRIPTALFASAGGYHHHVAMNVWNSRGAGPRAARLGLADVAITVPTRDDLDALAVRLNEKGLQFADTGRSIIAKDPWGTQVSVSLPGAGAEDMLSA